MAAIPTQAISPTIITPTTTGVNASVINQTFANDREFSTKAIANIATTTGSLLQRATLTYDWPALPLQRWLLVNLYSLHVARLGSSTPPDIQPTALIQYSLNNGGAFTEIDKVITVNAGDIFDVVSVTSIIQLPPTLIDTLQLQVQIKAELDMGTTPGSDNNAFVDLFETYLLPIVESGQGYMAV